MTRRLIPAFGVLAVVVFGGCNISTTRTAEAGPERAEHAAFAERAETRFATRPRTIQSVEAALGWMAQAVRSVPQGHPARYEYAARAARFGVWLARRLDGEEAESFADRALVFANTAVQEDPEQVEGYYWRAIAAGVFAQEARVRRGQSAMRLIRDDGNEAVRIDPTFDHGGPHRLLATLYLRAPGPPSGVGSTLRARHHIAEAMKIAPDHPANLLVLAELYVAEERRDEAEEVLESVLTEDTHYGEPRDRRAWRRRAEELLSRIGGDA